jgi:geranylgeranyl pyrophosphate synthase
MGVGEVTRIGSIGVDELPRRLGLADDLDRLKDLLSTWANSCASEMRDLLRWQLRARSKYFRPLTILACHTAVTKEPVSDRLLRSAAALELFHNVSLIIDDIVDRSRHRRGKLTLHCRFGELRALMAAGYLTAGGFALVSDDSYAVGLLAEVMQRLGVAECLQWRLRRQPLGVEDWRAISGEDTGSMFEVCAKLGTRDNRLKEYGRLLGMLYHGCDDVGDVRGLAALGGGGDEDVRDGILTLPAAIAIRDPTTAALFRDPQSDTRLELMRRIAGALPEAEAYLDTLAEEARLQARREAENPQPLLDLVSYTRALSQS